MTNTGGTITSQVSVNQAAGLSIVSYTGTATNVTVGHGLNAVPKFIIIKGRNATANPWIIAHDYGAFNWATDYFRFDTTAKSTDGASLVFRAAPTSTGFSLGGAQSVNENNKTFIAYVFAEVPGFSKFGSYTGNGSTDGPFVYTGFRPRWVMVKLSSTTGSWYIGDSARDAYNIVGNILLADSSNTETTGNAWIDFTSNGFKLKYGGGSVNANSQTHIYAAFAEAPFKYANAR